MGRVVNLFNVTKDGRHWNAKDVLEEAQRAFDEGEIKADSKLVVLHLNRETQQVGFAQNGLGAMELIAMLEVAKLKIYNDYIVQKD